MINYQSYHCFNDGGVIEPHAEIATATAVAAAGDDGSQRQILQQQQQRGFTKNFNNTVAIDINQEDDGGIEIDDGDTFHHGCMIDISDHENHILGCHVSTSTTDHVVFNNNNETNSTLASIHTNVYDQAEIINNEDEKNNNISINDNNGENHEHNDDDDNCWQVVPDNLDHLSRDELCRIIYRLDYERNALLLLREQQQQQQQQQPGQPQQLEQFMTAPTVHPYDDHRQDLDVRNDYNPGHGNVDIIDYHNDSDRRVNKKKLKRKKKKRARDSNDRSSLTAVNNNMQSCIPTLAHASTAMDTSLLHRANFEQEDQQQLPHSLQRVSRNNEFETNNEFNGIVFTTAVEDLRSRIRQSLIGTILSSAIHGGRRIPKSTVKIEGVSSGDINHIMYYGTINIATKDNSNNELGDIVYEYSTNNEDRHNLRVLADTKRMIKLRITGENYIAKVLGRGEERLIHPVRHDGTGIYVLSSSSASSSVSSNVTNDGGSECSTSHNQRTRKGMYHYARFQSLDVKYDKWDKVLTIIAKTVAADTENGRESASSSTA